MSIASDLLVSTPLSLSPQTVSELRLGGPIAAISSGSLDSTDELRDKLSTITIKRAEGKMVDAGTSRDMDKTLELNTFFGFASVLMIFMALAGLSLRRPPPRHRVERLKNVLSEIIWLAGSGAAILVSGVVAQVAFYQVQISAANDLARLAIESITQSSLVYWGVSGTIALGLSLLPPLLTWQFEAISLANHATRTMSGESRAVWLKDAGLNFSLGRAAMMALAVAAPALSSSAFKLLFSAG